MADYYGGGMDGDDAAAPSMAGDDEGGEESQDKGEFTALLPKQILAGKHFDPGEEVVLKIVHDHGDQIEVAYATGKADDEDGEDMDEDESGEEDEDGGSEMDKAQKKLSSMGYRNE